MADILQLLTEFLRINCQVVSCYYPNPVEGIFYLVLLPAALLIAFVYLIFQNLRIGHKGIQLLIAVVVLGFIILNGWFTIFVSLSYLWIIIIIVLGIIWGIWGRKQEGKLGAPRAMGFLRGATLGRRKLPFEAEWLQAQKVIKDDLRIMKAQLKEQDDLLNSPGLSPDEKKVYSEAIRSLKKKITYYDECLKTRQIPDEVRAKMGG